MPDLQLEPDLEAPYRAWRSKRNPQTTATLLTSLQPTIDRGLQLFGGGPNPVLAGKAKRLTLQALETYDPNQGRLATHVTNHLRGLQRSSRQQLSVLGAPQRAFAEYNRLNMAHQDLEDSLGRTPTTLELADKLSWSVTKIRKLQNLQMGVPASQLTQQLDNSWLPGVQRQTGAWTDLIYPDLTPSQQLIIDHTLGLHGRRVLSNQQLAGKLGLSPGAISQQKERLQRILDDEQLLSPL